MKKHMLNGNCSCLLLLLAVSCLLILPGTEAKNKSQERGRVLYEASCQCCHREGRNPLRPEKHLAESSKLVSQNTFKDYLSKKHGLMPNFAKIAEHDTLLSDLYKYAKSLDNVVWDEPIATPQPQDLPLKDHPPKSAAE